MMYKFIANKCGFTLIELIVVVSMIAILAAIALPAFSHFAKKYSADGAVFEIASAFEKGKVLAMKYKEEVSFSVDVDGDGNKDNGYCLYFDKNRDKKVDDNEVIQRKIFENVSFDFDKTTVDGTSKPIVFHDSGYVKGGSVFVKISENEQMKVSISSIIGRVSVVRIHEN